MEDTDLFRDISIGKDRLLDKGGQRPYDLQKYNIAEGHIVWTEKLQKEGFSEIRILSVEEHGGKGTYGDDDDYAEAVAAKDGKYFRLKLHFWHYYRPGKGADTGTDITACHEISQAEFQDSKAK